MKILLLNRTAIVQSLIKKLATQRGDELYLSTSSEIGLVDVVIVDDSCASQYESDQLRELASFCILLTQDDSETLSGYDKVIKKPFLPRELDLVLDLAVMRVGSIDESAILNMDDIDDVKELLDDLDSTQSVDDLEFDNIDLDLRAKEALEDIAAIIGDPSVIEAFRQKGVSINISFGAES